MTIKRQTKIIEGGIDIRILDLRHKGLQPEARSFARNLLNGAGEGARWISGVGPRLPHETHDIVKTLAPIRFCPDFYIKRQGNHCALGVVTHRAVY